MLVQISALFWRLSRNVSADIGVILTLSTALLQIEEGGVKLRYMEKVSILITDNSHNYVPAFSPKIVFSNPPVILLVLIIFVKIILIF